MKLAKLSLAAILALGASAYALEDIKVSGGVKVWYETADKGTGTSAVDMFDKNGATADVVFNLKATGKQGNVGFGVNVYQDSSMGLEGELVNSDEAKAVRTNSENGDMFVGELYITAPVLPNTIMKLGKQELQTPLAYTEKWNSVPNTFNAAVLINNSIENVTLIGAYVGEGNSGTATARSWKVNADGEMTRYHGGAYAFGALTKINNVAVNAWYYHLNEVNDTLLSTTAYWLDASTTIANFNVKAILAGVAGDYTNATDDVTAFALSAGTKVGDFDLSAAYSTVSEDNGLRVANTATGFKKTKLPTAGVYTDGYYVALPGSDAFKIKASTKVAGYGLALQYVDNSNDYMGTTTAGVASKLTAGAAKTAETSEIDFIVTKKFGDTSVKAIFLDRDFDDTTTDNAAGGQHIRIIASWAF
jgi:hypothetical protein